jgi:hypothetical protein
MLSLPLGPYQPTLELCEEAMAASDKPVIAACRRLARMMVDSGDTMIDVMVGYALSIKVEPPAAAARAEAERDAMRAEMVDGYYAVLQAHALPQDLVADLRNWLRHGEIEMMRRGLARVEAELVSRDAAARLPDD